MEELSDLGDKPLESMTDEEIVRGLMRGDKREFKAGYNPAAASHAVAHLRKLDERRQWELYTYARGFAHGMQEDSALTNPTPEPESDQVSG